MPPERRSQHQREELIPREFFHLTREQFAIVKSHHHLHRLRAAPPPSLQRKAKELATFAKPAFRNEFFDARANQLAEDWLRGTYQALLEHYEDTLATSRSALEEAAMPRGIFERSLQVCTRWARRQLGAKLEPSILDAAISEIRGAQMVDDASDGPSFTKPRQLPTTTVHRSVQTQTDVQSTPEPTKEVWFSQRLPDTQATEDPGATVGRQVAETVEVTQAGETVEVTQAAETDEVTEAAETAEVTQADETAEVTQATESQPASESDGCAPPEPMVFRLSRKRQAEEHLSQMDLFGSPISQRSPPRQRSRSLPAQLRLAPSKGALILGDDNVATFGDERTDVLATKNGRLNFFRTLLRSAKDTFPGVTRFVLVLSHLDRQNAHNTNFTAIRNIFSVAKSLFPNAQGAVACDGPCECQPSDVRSSIEVFNKELQAAPPNRIAVILPPEGFACTNGRWAKTTREAYRANISAFLV